MSGRDAASAAQTRAKRRRGRHDERVGTKSEEEACCLYYFRCFFSKTKMGELTDFLSEHSFLVIVSHALARLSDAFENVYL